MIIFIASLILIVFLHELAHAIAAILVGGKIEIISLGLLGKPIYKKKINNVIYQITYFPFGGDCQLKGERTYNLDSDAFCNLTYTKKAIITLAGCFINLFIGFICLFIGNYFCNYTLSYFGFINIILGLSNLLPIPCLDGSYLLFIWLEKIYGKERGYKLFIKINKIALNIWIVLNFACILFIAFYMITGGKIWF